MRRLSLFLPLVAVLVLLIGAWPAQAGTITDSVHDFSSAGWNTTGEICITCHTPHNADTTVAEAPLWNHATTTTSGFDPYDSTTLNASVGQPTGIALLCLSCHDGAVALDNFGGSTSAGTFMGDVNTAAEVGSDLSNDHPVSFVYNAALATADGELYDPTTQAWDGGADTISAAVLEGGDTLQCSSCHDVHNTETPESVGFLLRKSNAGSALCLECHNK